MTIYNIYLEQYDRTVNIYDRTVYYRLFHAAGRMK